MVVVHLVRHGRAAAGWDDHLDPDLDELGREQAAAVARTLAPIGPLDVLTSPMVRCRSTARPLCESWGVDAVVEPAVVEMPSPDGVPTSDRIAWLRTAMSGTWTDLGAPYRAYRDSVVERIRQCAGDTVVFSHFVAINAVIGACTGDERVVVRSLDNCSVTVVEVSGRELRLVHGGDEADTLIR